MLNLNTGQNNWRTKTFAWTNVNFTAWQKELLHNPKIQKF